ncbi:hypothetical protein BMS3Bbin16_01248 [archaeon BMS3Bbin16]|nr:hypothetical protein BMS3Bbin16_01248 [archaeon BMS3Bbin16]
MVVSFPKTWAHAMRTASACVGFTLPGMIDEPGSFAGIVISPSPAVGPLAIHRISFAIFVRLTATVFKTPLSSTIVSWAAIPSPLSGFSLNLIPVICEMFLTTSAEKPSGVLIPVPTAVPPMGSSSSLLLASLSLSIPFPICAA